MPDQTVEELRNDLRDKRTNTLRSDRKFVGGTDGTGVSTISRNVRSDVPGLRPINLVSGRDGEKSVRSGRSNRRSSGSDGGTSSGDAAAAGNERRRKRIKAEDTISRSYEEGLQPSVTIPKRPVGRPPKIITTVADVEKKLTTVVKDTFSGSNKKVLSKQEADTLRDPLKAVIPDMSGYLDELIWWQTKDGSQTPIWSDIDDDEIEIISRLLLKQGQKNAVVAEGVRTMVDAADWIAAGMIVIPRTITSMKKLTAIAAEERKKKLEARYAITDQRPFISEQPRH